MPLPVAHALLGASIVVAAGQPSIDLSRARVRKVALGAFLATVPDLDFIATWFFHFDKSWHRSFTHSLVIAIVVGSLFSFWERKEFRTRWSMVYISAIASHGLLDFLVSVKSGVTLLWPLTLHRFAAGLFEYPDTLEVRYTASLDLLLIRNSLELLRLAAIELVIFGALLSFTLFVKSKSELRTP